MSHVIVGTAGHIDHGKTALVKALTGIDADRLKEEKERGITIDIGFAHLALDSKTTIGFIDVPGHERFIKNMLAGVGGIDLVILVVAADESIMPQTREHLDICSLLQIKQGFTVLTKIDKVDPDVIGLVEMEVREFLKGSFLERSPILHMSSKTGAGIPEIIENLRKSVAEVQPKNIRDIFRLPVDRCFTMKGFGTVATGTLISGRVQKEQEVEILPVRRLTRVRGIQVHGRAAAEALAGQRTALNLQGVDVSEVVRGMVLTEPRLFLPSSMLDCYLELLPSAPGPIALRKRVRFHTGTVELIGHVVLLGQDRLQPGDSGFVQIRLEKPSFVLPGDRFIIRQYSPMITIGGGQILDGAAAKHRRSDQSVIQKLRVFKDGEPDAVLMALIDDAGLAGIAVSKLAAMRGMVLRHAGDRLVALAKRGLIRLFNDNPATVVSALAFKAAAEAAVTAVKRFHETNPLAQGIGREELRARMFGDASITVFNAVLDQMIAERKLGVSQDLVHDFGRKVTLQGEQEQMRADLQARFQVLGLQASSVDQVIDSLKLDRTTARKIVQLMLKENTLVKINEEMVVDRGVINKLVADVRALKSKTTKLGVSEFKDLTGISRKYAIPLLEYLDRQRVTRRVGDERMIL
jgi:selenocysteine-specific elongation factor